MTFLYHAVSINRSVTPHIIMRIVTLYHYTLAYFSSIIRPELLDRMDAALWKWKLSVTATRT